MAPFILSEVFKMTAKDFKPNEAVELVDFTMTIVKSFSGETLLREIDEDGVQMRGESSTTLPQKDKLRHVIDFFNFLQHYEEHLLNSRPSSDELENGNPISPIVLPREEIYFVIHPREDLFHRNTTLGDNFIRSSLPYNPVIPDPFFLATPQPSLHFMPYYINDVPRWDHWMPCRTDFRSIHSAAPGEGEPDRQTTGMELDSLLQSMDISDNISSTTIDLPMSDSPWSFRLPAYFPPPPGMPISGWTETEWTAYEHALQQAVGLALSRQSSSGKR